MQFFVKVTKNKTASCRDSFVTFKTVFRELRSHHRMVTAVCWGPDPVGQAPFSQQTASATTTSSGEWRSTRPNLFSAGFDRLAFGWCMKTASSNKDDGPKVKDKTSKDGF